MRVRHNSQVLLCLPPSSTDLLKEDKDPARGPGPRPWEGLGSLGAESTAACLHGPLGPKCCCRATKAKVRNVPFSRVVLGASRDSSTPSPTDAEEHAEALSFALLPKQCLPEPQSKATHTDLPAGGKLRPQGRSLGKSAGGSAIPSFHLLGAQLETLTEGTAKWSIPLPEGMRAPSLLLDGQGVLRRARARDHQRKLL